jgi:hypothetical protein
MLRNALVTGRPHARGYASLPSSEASPAALRHSKHQACGLPVKHSVVSTDYSPPSRLGAALLLLLCQTSLLRVASIVHPSETDPLARIGYPCFPMP